MSCSLLIIFTFEDEQRCIQCVTAPLIAAMYPARHYVNNVVQYTTGVHNASAQLVRHTFGNQERNMPHFSLLLVRLLQCITDASNWSKVKATGNAVVASMVYLAGSTATTRVRAVVAGQSYAPGFQHPVRRAAVAAVASAAASCPQASMARRVADFGALVGDRANRVKTGVSHVNVHKAF